MNENESKKNLKLVKNPETVEKQIPDEEKTCANDCEPAPPSTVYEVLMARMTPEQLASISVQLVQVNGSELFWMTSVGQLYPFNNKKAAFEAEYAWLMSSPNLDNK